jgi:hypothetical protein
MAAIDPSIDIVLEYCKFFDPAVFDRVNDGFGSFHDIERLDHKDVKGPC